MIGQILMCLIASRQLCWALHMIGYSMRRVHTCDRLQDCINRDMLVWLWGR